jgi:hypothetical protein
MKQIMVTSLEGIRMQGVTYIFFLETELEPQKIVMMFKFSTMVLNQNMWL